MCYSEYFNVPDLISEQKIKADSCKLGGLVLYFNGCAGKIIHMISSKAFRRLVKLKVYDPNFIFILKSTSVILN